MRILRVDSWDGVRGGTQSYIRDVTSALALRGHETRLLNLVSVPEASNDPTVRFVPVPPVGGRRIPHDLLAAPAVEAALAEELSRFRPDLVHLHHFDTGFASIARWVRALRVPVVMTAHDAELVCPISTLVRPGRIICEGGVEVRCLFTGCKVGYGGVYNLLQSESFGANVAPKIRAYLCPSRPLVEYLDRHGFRPAVRLPSFAEIPASVRAAPTPEPPSTAPPTVGYLGRIEPYKGVLDLADAVGRLRSRFPDLRLDIAGEGPFRPKLEEHLRALGLTGTTTFRGRVEGAAKERWFAGIHLLAMPSNAWENFGLVALEALARGRPVVATRVGGIPDIVEDSSTGLLVSISEPEALARAIGRLLEDPGLRDRLGSEGRRRVLDRFTPERHVAALLAVYEAVLRGETIPNGVDAESLVRHATN
ncbi:MAG TPA: glycosyltransferase family 4 protein [Thermoplasmata archaeon]|nr:glycosyltransferase family 4 protein [Thermoplasmata archaeon]